MTAIRLFVVHTASECTVCQASSVYDRQFYLLNHTPETDINSSRNNNTASSFVSCLYSAITVSDDLKSCCCQLTAFF